MNKFILGRVVQAVISLVVVSIFVFSIVRISGDPLHNLLPLEAPQEQYDEMRKLLHLDEPIHIQYVTWASGILRGDFGDSIFFRRSVGSLIASRLPNTLLLAGVAFLFALVIGLIVGVYSASNRGSRFDVISRSVAIIGMAAPSFWLGLMLIMVFAVQFGVLPAGGKGDWKSVILPAITLGSFPVAGLMRLTRSSMIEVLSSEYIKLARIKGVSEVWVLWKHAFRNAGIPVLTFGGIIFIGLLRGSVITETVFAWPGIGRLVLEGVINRDFPIVQGVVLLFSSWYILMNLIVDISYSFINPKIRYS